MKRRKDGLYPLHFHYKDAHGISREKTVYGKTISEAKGKKESYLQDVKQAIRLDQSGRTVSSWADEWLSIYKKDNVCLRTYEAYSYDVSIIKGFIGNKSLKSVTQADIQKIVNSRKGLSASVIRKTMMTVKAIFQSAVENRFISFSPCIGVKTIPGTSGTHRALNDDEIKKILACKGHRFSAAAAFMALAGLRKGEVAALRYEDISDHVIVNKAISWPSNQPVIGYPKSKAGARQIPLFNPLKDYTGTGLILPGRNGIVSECEFVNAHKSFMKECGVTFQCHDLRHSFCTLIYESGVDVKTAQLWLGHADISMTLRIYTHLSKAQLSTVTEATSKAISDRLVVKTVVDENTEL